MSNPASRERRAASAQSSTSLRRSDLVISLGTTPVAKSLASCDGPTDASRDSEFSACTPVWPSSIPASDPSACASSHITESMRTSWSSHSRAATYGVSSDSALTAQYSVQTAAQPPSALTARCRDCDHGFSTPKPVQ